MSAPIYIAPPGVQSGEIRTMTMPSGEQSRLPAGYNGVAPEPRRHGCLMFLAGTTTVGVFTFGTVANAVIDGIWSSDISAAQHKTIAP